MRKRARGLLWWLQWAVFSAAGEIRRRCFPILFSAPTNQIHQRSGRAVTDKAGPPHPHPIFTQYGRPAASLFRRHPKYLRGHHQRRAAFHTPTAYIQPTYLILLPGSLGASWLHPSILLLSLHVRSLLSWIGCHSFSFFREHIPPSIRAGPPSTTPHPTFTR